MTLRARITLLTAGLLLVALLALGIALEGLLRSFLYRNLRGELLEASNQVVRLLNLGGQALLEAGLLRAFTPRCSFSPRRTPPFWPRKGESACRGAPPWGRGGFFWARPSTAPSWKRARSGPCGPSPGGKPLAPPGLRPPGGGQPLRGGVEGSAPGGQAHGGPGGHPKPVRPHLRWHRPPRPPPLPPPGERPGGPGLEPLEWVARRAEAMPERPEPLPSPKAGTRWPPWSGP